MPQAKAKAFAGVKIRVNYDSVPREVVVQGQMRVDGSQGGLRAIYARLTLEEALALEFELHISILAVQQGMPAGDPWGTTLKDLKEPA